MLTSLKIKNVALIKSLTVDFTAGLNILSGETGAGKSIIIDSLSFVLGSKADKSMIRNGEDGCEVTAVFELDTDSLALDILEELGLEREETVLLKRSLDISGKSKNYINGLAVPCTMLKNFTSHVCDIHGQSEHHSLMKVSTHIDLLDKFGKDEMENELYKVGECYAEYKAVRKELAAFGENAEERARRADLLKYQIDEIDEADIGENELAELTAQRKKMLNFEKLLTALRETSALLLENDVSAVDCVGTAIGLLRSVSDFDAEVAEQTDRLTTLKYDLDDIAGEIENLLVGYDDGESGETSLERIEMRIDLIKCLFKKYGKSYEEVYRYYENAVTEYDRLTKSEKLISELSGRMDQTRKKLITLCGTLSEKRRTAADALEKAIMGELIDLGLKNAVFKVAFEEKPTAEEFDTRISPNGWDSVEFYMTANLGQPLKPLVKVISGGEASRFMLALKTITCNIDKIPSLVFDEIDTGISGEIAQMVARKFAVIANNHQLLAITHLPQIAAMGDTNFLIEKRTNEGDTLTDIRMLNAVEKEREVARLAGGSNIGEHGILHARELIAWSDDCKRA